MHGWLRKRGKNGGKLQRRYFILRSTADGGGAEEHRPLPQGSPLQGSPQGEGERRLEYYKKEQAAWWAPKDTAQGVLFMSNVSRVYLRGEVRVGQMRDEEGRKRRVGDV